MNHFKTFGLEAQAAQDPALIKARFHGLSLERHPDVSPEASAKGDDFSDLNEAFQVLQSPARRLRHLLELKADGKKVDLKGVVPAKLMDLFTSIGPELQGADGLLVEKEKATTALTEALLVDRIMERRESLESLNAEVREAIEWDVGQFEDLDGLWSNPDPETDGLAFVLGVTLCRSLLYLERWKSQIQTRLHALTF